MESCSKNLSTSSKAEVCSTLSQSGAEVCTRQTPSLLLSSTEQVYFHVCRNTHSYWPRNSEQITKGNEILKSQFN